MKTRYYLGTKLTKCFQKLQAISRIKSFVSRYFLPNHKEEKKVVTNTIPLQPEAIHNSQDVTSFNQYPLLAVKGISPLAICNNGNHMSQIRKTITSFKNRYKKFHYGPYRWPPWIEFLTQRSDPCISSVLERFIIHRWYSLSKIRSTCFSYGQ